MPSSIRDKVNAMRYPITCGNCRNVMQLSVAKLRTPSKTPLPCENCKSQLTLEAGVALNSLDQFERDLEYSYRHKTKLPQRQYNTKVKVSTKLVKPVVIRPNLAVEAQQATVASLRFDGKKLCWIEKSLKIQCWPAVSGREGYQDKKYQDEKDKGPLPEGTWNVRQNHYQTISDIDSWQRIKGALGGGTWRGLEKSWGEHRIWLEPLLVPNLYARSGFTIHGGDIPGSAGCIDLTFYVGSFATKFLEYRRDMELTVKYE